MTATLTRAGLTGLVAISPANVAYIAGFTTPRSCDDRAPRFAVFSPNGTALVLPATDAPAVVADPLDVEHVVVYGAVDASFSAPVSQDAQRVRAMVTGAAPGALDALVTALDRLDIRQGCLGIDETGLGPDPWHATAERLAHLKPTRAASSLADARRVKGPYELECLAHALRIAEEGLDAVIQAIDRGMSEREAAMLYAGEVVRRGAWPSPPMIAMGERTWIRAPWPTDRALRSNDLVRFDVGCVYKGYCGSVARMAVLGDPMPRAEAALAAVQVGLEAAAAAAVPGSVAGRLVDAAARAVRAQGLPDHADATVGHGIGMEACERPRLAAGDAATLEPGEVLQIDVGHYDIGSIGVAIRDTFLITSAGARGLNRSRRELIVLD